MRVLIVGATSAVAQEVALQFANKNADIFCFARNEEKMVAIEEQLRNSLKGSFCFDFNNNDQTKHAVDLAIESLGGIDIAFVAHGNLLDQIESEHNFDIVRSTFETNCLSVISLLIPISEQMVKQGTGKIGVITSVAGDRGRPRNFTYGAAKGGLSIYLQGLRSSLWGSGVEIYDFKMGPVDTPMTVDHEKNFSFSTIDHVASQMVRAFQGKRYELYVPAFWFWVMLAVRNMPECIFQKLKFLSAR